MRGMITEAQGWAEGLREFGLTAFGIVLALMPLALWVAWSETVFVVVLTSGLTAGVACCLLAHDWRPAFDARGGTPGPRPTRVSTDEFIAGLHELFPLIHHHRRLGDPVFQRKMDALKRLLKS